MFQKRKIGDKTFEKIEEFAKEQNLSLFEALGKADDISGLSANLKITILDFYKMMKEFIEISEGTPVSELFDTIVREIKYSDYLIANYEDYETRKENIEELKNSIIELEKVIETLTLREYLEKYIIS